MSEIQLQKEEKHESIKRNCEKSCRISESMMREILYQENN